jgi:hypothetical protein
MIRKIMTEAARNADIRCHSIYEAWPVQVKEGAIRIGGPRKIRGLPVAKDDISPLGQPEFSYVDKEVLPSTRRTGPSEIPKRREFYVYSSVTPQF